MIDETDSLIGTQDPANTITDLRNQLQQLRLAADGMAAAAEEYARKSMLVAIANSKADSGKEKDVTASYRAAGEGLPKDTGTSRE